MRYRLTYILGSITRYDCIFLKLMSPMLLQGFCELRYTIRRIHDVVVCIPRHVFDDTGDRLAKRDGVSVGVSIVRCSHEDQTKSRRPEVPVPWIIFCVHESLLDENSAEAVTYEYEGTFRMLPVEHVSVLIRGEPRLYLHHVVPPIEPPRIAMPLPRTIHFPCREPGSNCICKAWYALSAQSLEWRLLAKGGH